MDNCYVDIEVNLSRKKELILRRISDEDLEDELENRIIKNIIVKKTDFNFEFNVDISEFSDEILDELTDTELIDELDYRDYTVFVNSDVPEDVVCSKSGIAELLGLKWWATKQQILDELENIL